MAAALARARATVLYASPLQLARLAAVAGATAAPGAASGALDRGAAPRRTSPPRFEATRRPPARPSLRHHRGRFSRASTPATTRRVPATASGAPVPGYEIAVLSEDGAPRRRPVSTGEVGIRGARALRRLLRAVDAARRRARARLVHDRRRRQRRRARRPHAARPHASRRSSSPASSSSPRRWRRCSPPFPAIAESRVFARPHPRLGELPHAELVLRDDARARPRRARRATAPGISRPTKSRSSSPW